MEGPFIAFIAPTESWADPTVNAWAPEVHRFRGKYYLFTTLHNPAKVLPTTDSSRPNSMRSTMIAVGNSPVGPFVLTKTDAPVAPANFMTLDGTLYVDRAGKPWMVYAHEWLQKVDGTMEAVPLTDDLSSAMGAPIHLFKASDAPWLNAQMTPNTRENHYVTDGPELFRTRSGALLMLWASYMQNELGRNGYVQTVARSRSGELAGPARRQRQWPRHALPHVRRDIDDGVAPAVPECASQALRNGGHRELGARAEVSRGPQRAPATSVAGTGAARVNVLRASRLAFTAPTASSLASSPTTWSRS